MTKGKPWHLKEGFLLGAGLIVMGLVLQLSIGPINWSIFTWPVNIVALGVLVAVIVGIVWNYQMQRFFVFRHPKSQQAEPEAESMA